MPYNTIESRYNGPASNGNPPIMEVVLKSIEKIFFILYIGDNRNPPITNKNCWSLEIRQSGQSCYISYYEYRQEISTYISQMNMVVVASSDISLATAKTSNVFTEGTIKKLLSIKFCIFRCTHLSLYKRLCPSIRRSVGGSVICFSNITEMES